MGGIRHLDAPQSLRSVYQEENYEGPASLSSCSHLTWGTGPNVARPGHLLCNMSHCWTYIGHGAGAIVKVLKERCNPAMRCGASIKGIP
jgi:hypothetical protein